MGESFDFSKCEILRRECFFFAYPPVYVERDGLKMVVEFEENPSDDVAFCVWVQLEGDDQLHLVYQDTISEEENWPGANIGEQIFNKIGGTDAVHDELARLLDFADHVYSRSMGNETTYGFDSGERCDCSDPSRPVGLYDVGNFYIGYPTELPQKSLPDGDWSRLMLNVACGIMADTLEIVYQVWAQIKDTPHRVYVSTSCCEGFENQEEADMDEMIRMILEDMSAHTNELHEAVCSAVDKLLYLDEIAPAKEVKVVKAFIGENGKIVTYAPDGMDDNETEMLNFVINSILNMPTDNEVGGGGLFS